jgi:hypothetical protein
MDVFCRLLVWDVDSTLSLGSCPSLFFVSKKIFVSKKLRTADNFFCWCPKTKKMYIELKDQTIHLVGHELHSRGIGYIALDRRRQFLFVGTNLKRIAEGIDVYAHEEMGRTSMYDCVSCTSKRGYAGSFRFERCPLGDLPALVQLYRARYQRVIICATLKSAWRLGEPLQHQPKVEEEDEMLVVESNL